MSRKQRKHIRGKRGEAFLQIVRGIDRACILCVSRPKSTVSGLPVGDTLPVSHELPSSSFKHYISLPKR